MIKKIISGGQTGADIGGLLVAKKFSLETGGWLPKGCKTELGPRTDLLERFNMQEHTSSDYPGRTYANARDSDGTIWFGNTTSPGAKCTFRAAKNYNKIPFVAKFTKENMDSMIQWVKENDIQILNVAGNRESKNPGICVNVVDYLSYVLESFGFTSAS